MGPFVVKVGFSTSKRLLSRLIRFLTKGKASHTWLYIEDSFLGVDMVLQADTGGFHLGTFAAFERKHHIVQVIRLEHSVEKGLVAATQWLGASYDYTGLFGSAAVLIGRWLKRKWKNPLNSSKAMFCSEAVVRILQLSDYPGSELLDPSATTPQDLLVFLTPDPKS